MTIDDLDSVTARERTAGMPTRLLVLIVGSLMLCGCSRLLAGDGLVNFGHLDRLTTAMTVEGASVLAVAIYANAPEYEPVDEPGEGYACLDDTARAAILLMDHHESFGDEAALLKAQGMVRFVLQLQSGNGLFYNFVYPDGRINRHGKTSRRKFDFWTARGMWVLGRAVAAFAEQDLPFARRCERAARLTMQAFASRVFSRLQLVERAGRQLPAFQLLCGNDC